MARRDLFDDAAEHAQRELLYALDEHKRTTTESEPTVSVQEAMSGERTVAPQSTRDVTRVLFISRNEELLNPAEQSLDGFVKLADLFEEVHIVILRQGIKPTHPVLRVDKNVWLYTASAKNWWWTPVSALKLIHEQLVFAEGFRPDLVVARDPFECAFVARLVGRRYKRPTQLHVLEDYTTRDFTNANRHNVWRRFMPKWLIPSFPSVRTETRAIKTLIQKRFTVPDIDVLPRFTNYESLIGRQPTIDLKERYKPFIFIMLFIGRLSHESTLYRAIDAARFVLRNPRVGLVVLGDGPARPEFENRAKLLGISEQVVFEQRDVDEIDYLNAANLALVTDTDADSDAVALRAAAMGTPLVMAETPTRLEHFTNGTSAFLCPPEDTQVFTDRINDVLNDISLRGTFARNSPDIIREHFHQDPELYRQAYRASIEQALFVEADEMAGE